MSAAVAALLPSPLDDDFDLIADADSVLDGLELHVVADPGSGSPALAASEILITGISTQEASPLAYAEAMPRLRWIHSMTAGVENLLAQRLLERNILVTSAAGAYAGAMAEYAFAAMVMLARQLPELIVASSRREWREPHQLGRELRGRRVGIVGYGGIGRALARLCSPAGMRVWGVRRRPRPDPDGAAEVVVGLDRLEEVLAASDFVVVAASLNPSSRGLLRRAQFDAMKPGTFLVNVSRGALVDEAALVGALRSARLAGAVIDVTDVEPLPAESELWRVPNLWITPHMSGGTLESRARAFDVLLTNCRAYLGGNADEMLNRVDLERELHPPSHAPEGERC